MVRVQLPGGEEKTYPNDRIAVSEVIESLGGSWRKQAVAAQYGGITVDLHMDLEGEGEFRILLDKDVESLDVLRHSASHILAYAVLELFPDAKLAIGPPIEDGFYYDFDVEKPFTPEDLEKIEAKMNELLKSQLDFKRDTWDKAKAIEFFNAKNQGYKIELIEELEDENVGIYRVGEFTDLCAGPHLENTKKIKNFKVLHAAGAYWRGDSRKPMLQRIYATAFFKQKDLKAYLDRMAEAEKRDHRKLGKALDLYDVRDEAGGGLVFWYPKGALIRESIERYLKNEYIRRGYELVLTPHIARSELWHTSGHYDYYAENMYNLDVEGHEFILKPMNCPGHILIYKRRLYSYRDLPVRFAEMGTVYRKELSGTLHGLLRVRGFTQDDAHIFCTPEQLDDEVDRNLEFALDVLAAHGFEEYKIELSVRDPNKQAKYAGSVEEWDMAEAALERAIERNKLDFKRMSGEAVFYGPKIDIKVIDAIGRPWQLSTIQFDFNLPKRFNVTYVAQDGERKQVFMVHRALLGSVERFVGILTEHYAGAFPLWLAPVQCVVLPVTGAFAEYAAEVRDKLTAAGLRAEIDARDEKIGYKVREAELQKVPFMLVVGQREAESGSVAVRERSEGDKGSRDLDEFIRETVDAAVPNR
ncbi:MAG: threonine--tRNA ligase [Candidatus Latescibacterota bacterium]|nr:MAG: threonine--tRNA ligase [Candidatus Latescibacterota bacterium]